MLNRELASWAKCSGNLYARNTVTRQGRKSPPSFFDLSNVEVNAKIEARKDASLRGVPFVDYAEFERIFVVEYITAYSQALADWHERKATRGGVWKMNIKELVAVAQ